MVLDYKEKSNMGERKKVIVLGLDGATFNVIHPLIKKKKLLNFKKMMDEGSFSKLQSTVPPLSSSAWTSFSTGMEPSNHGIYDFIIKKPFSYDESFLNANMIKAPYFWETLGRKGKKVIVQNILVTYPVKPVNGHLITGFLTPPDRPYTYPENFRNELEQKFGSYPRPSGASSRKGLEDEYIKSTFENMDKRIKITKYLMNTKEWDLFVVLFEGTDVLQHSFWKYYEDKEKKFDKEKNYQIMKDCIPEVYKKFDNFLGELLDEIDDNTTVIILSDHGFDRVEKVVLMNNILMQMGLLSLKRTPFTKLKMMCLKHHLNIENLLKIVEKIGISVQGAAKDSGDGQHLINKLFLSKEDIDWKKTKAFSIGVGGHIYINLKGREPKGIVSLENYFHIVDFISRTLIEIKDPKTNKQVIQKAFRKDEIYKGKYSIFAPDIAILTGKGYFPLYKEHFISPSFLMKCPTSGNHILHGIFMIKGPDIKENYEISDMKIWDVPSVIFDLFNIKKGDMDGVTPKGIFR